MSRMTTRLSFLLAAVNASSSNGIIWNLVEEWNDRCGFRTRRNGNDDVGCHVGGAEDADEL